MSKLVKPISFQWDFGNLDKNKVKHGVDQKQIEEVFFNRPLKIFSDTKHSLIEKRFVALGMTDDARLLSIIFTLRGRQIRVISARSQSRKERNIYAKK